jgi:exonuclease SbcC
MVVTTWRWSEVRVESVTAVAFGPLRGAILEFAPQLTVIYGRNEAGKSSWHAAIYAALCGMRRARGALRREDQSFTDSHRPWDGAEWEVRAFVRLDTGQRVQLHQNLADLAHCSAVDADLGRDVAIEILNEGTPDATKWLGLDRVSFLAVACVRQAEIQAVVDYATSLQDELQRAATSAARHATAAEAVARLEEFYRECVGQDRAHSTKPLHRAKLRFTAAESALAKARQTHTEWLTIDTRALEQRARATEAERDLRAVRALHARRDAETWRAKLAQARELAEKYPAGPPPPLPSENALSGDVAAGLSEWETRPAIAVLTGPSAAEIRAEIDALPPMPSGDLAPLADVVKAKQVYDRAVQTLEIHEGQQPPDPETLDTKGLAAGELRGLATDLELSIPSVDQALEARLREARDWLTDVERVSRRRPAIAGLAALGVMAGVTVWTFWTPVVGALLIVAAIAGFVWLAFGSGEARRAQALEEIRTIEVMLVPQRTAFEEARERASSARGRVAKLGLSHDPLALRDLADAVTTSEQRRRIRSEWVERGEQLRADLRSTGERLAEALAQRGGDTRSDDLLCEFEEYVRACELRAEQAAHAGRRAGMKQQLAAREAAEQATRDASARRLSAERKVFETAATCGVKATSDIEAVEALRRWQIAHAKALAKFDEATREHAELRALLGEGTLADLELQVGEWEQAATALSAEFNRLPELAAGTGLDDKAARLESIAHDLGHQATATEAQARERARDVLSIAEAEEELALAHEDSERVTRLDTTLSLTLDFLRKAEERVHRDIAPVLAAGLRRRLPGVTEGRYTDARVDPADLSVQVLAPDGQWRNAERLSHGTTEQVYLLLRMVLAECLVTTGETCPLILDDVLVQSDRVRKRALLDAIRAVSRERQVILFTQEDEVLEWARDHLDSSDRLEFLAEAV